MRRLKNGQEYYVFPGGGVEEGESYEEALRREIKEELGVDIESPELIFELENGHYFLIKSFSGTPELGGPEKERMNDKNQYFLEWTELTDISDIEKMPNVYPREAVAQLIKFLHSQ